MRTKNERRKERHKALQNKVKDATANIVSKILRFSGLDKAFAKLLNWAESHRRGMFAITVSFLVAVVFITFASRPSHGAFGKVYNEVELQAIPDSVNSFDVLRSKERNVANTIGQMLQLQKLRNEMQQIQAKDTLTTADSLRVIKIYNTIIKNGDEPEQD